MDVRLAELDEDCREELRHIIEAIQSKLNIDAEDDQLDQCVKNIVSILPISVFVFVFQSAIQLTTQEIN